MLCPSGIICEDDVKVMDIYSGTAMVALVPDSHWGFVWHGGAYIDVIRQSSMGAVIINDTFWHYGEQNISVWDYDTGMPTIAWMDKEAFVSTINNWMEAMNG